MKPFKHIEPVLTGLAAFVLFSATPICAITDAYVQNNRYADAVEITKQQKKQSQSSDSTASVSTPAKSSTSSANSTASSKSDVTEATKSTTSSKNQTAAEKVVNAKIQPLTEAQVKKMSSKELRAKFMQNATKLVQLAKNDPDIKKMTQANAKSSRTAGKSSRAFSAGISVAQSPTVKPTMPAPGTDSSAASLVGNNYNTYTPASSSVPWKGGTFNFTWKDTVTLQSSTILSFLTNPGQALSEISTGIGFRAVVTLPWNFTATQVINSMDKNNTILYGNNQKNGMASSTGTGQTGSELNMVSLSQYGIGFKTDPNSEQRLLVQLYSTTGGNFNADFVSLLTSWIGGFGDAWFNQLSNTTANLPLTLNAPISIGGLSNNATSSSYFQGDPTPNHVLTDQMLSPSPSKKLPFVVNFFGSSDLNSDFSYDPSKLGTNGTNATGYNIPTWNTYISPFDSKNVLNTSTEAFQEVTGITATLPESGIGWNNRIMTYNKYTAATVPPTSAGIVNRFGRLVNFFKMPAVVSTMGSNLDASTIADGSATTNLTTTAPSVSGNDLASSPQTITWSGKDGGGTALNPVSSQLVQSKAPNYTGQMTLQNTTANGTAGTSISANKGDTIKVSGSFTDSTDNNTLLDGKLVISIPDSLTYVPSAGVTVTLNGKSYTYTNATVSGGKITVDLSSAMSSAGLSSITGSTKIGVAYQGTAQYNSADQSTTVPGIQLSGKGTGDPSDVTLATTNTGSLTVTNIVYSYGIVSAPNVDFGVHPVTGSISKYQPTDSTLALSMFDNYTTVQGWQLNLSSTTFTDGNNKTLSGALAFDGHAITNTPTTVYTNTTTHNGAFTIPISSNSSEGGLTYQTNPNDNVDTNSTYHATLNWNISNGPTS
ncbi:hypothetical protein [Levilactobacillus bambusae]|uniref:WxL domain-containing protein n=1 Tax=Levilactobacillus bambusae TaxID=2024736 RepID=A0A2V1N1P6_9LACO|nr:hypothetical protein [Levilactobacillus bambusae]PWG00276.1 hypothetical protein DCM90_04920 [Levilactobacillus bambusae]